MSWKERHRLENWVQAHRLSLHSSQKTVQSCIEALDIPFARLRAVLEEMVARLDAVPGRLGPVAVGLVGVDARVELLAAALDRVAASLERLDTRLDLVFATGVRLLGAPALVEKTALFRCSPFARPS